LFVSSPEVQESLAVAAYHRSKGARCEGDLLGIVFAQTFPGLACAPLQLSALRRVLKPDALRNEVTDEFQAFTCIATSLQKLGRSNAAHQQRPLRPSAILAQPSHSRSGNSRLNLTL